MNFAFDILVRVSFRHSYFINEVPDCFSIEPTAETATFLLDHALLFKQKDAGFLLAYESHTNGRERARDSVLSLDGTLKFVVALKDALFFNYTSVAVREPANSVFHFHNFDVKEKPFLHAGEHVESEDLVPKEGIASAFFSKPFAVIEIRLDKIGHEEYFIRFREKATFWRYLIVSDHLQDLNGPAVLNGTLLFKGPSEIRLPDNKNALAFESEVPIGLKQRPDKIFQLVENYDAAIGKGKTVIRALPQPDIKIISKLSVSEPREFSEIII